MNNNGNSTSAYLKQFFLNKYFIIITSVILLLIVFNDPFEEIVSFAFVHPLFSKVQSIWYNDLVVIVVSVYIFGITVHFKNKRYIPSINGTIFLVILSIVYLCYRIPEDVWLFVPFRVTEYVKYLDIILLLMACQLWLLFRTQTAAKSNAGFILESSLGKNGIDKLGYTYYASEIAAKILKTNSDSSFAIAINGKWGLGKSSFFDLIKRQLRADDIIEVDFEPWNSQGSEAIIKDFFDSIQDRLRLHHNYLSKLILQYSEKLVYVEGNAFTKLFKVVLDTSSTIYSLKEKIQKSLKKVDKKIIIYIDDLDRLDKREIVEVIRLIRNTANFYNTFFIVAFDRNYVINSLSQFNDHNKEIFLEKIFQLEITLPHFKHIKIREALNSKLKEHLDTSLYNDIDKATLGDDTSTPEYLEYWIETMRDVSRFANHFILNIKDIETEVVFSDLFRIELLRLKYPAVYEILHSRTSDFFILVDSNYLKQFYQLKGDQQQKPNYENFELTKYLKREHARLSVPENSIAIVVSLIKSIFEREIWETNEPEPLSVVYPSKFDRYFRFSLDAGELSELDFSKGRALNQNGFEQRIKEWVKEGLESELRDKLENIELFENKEDFEKVIKAIFFMASLPTEETGIYGQKEIVGFDSRSLYNKIDHRSAKNYYSKSEELSNFIKDIFNAATKPYFFESQFIYYAKRHYFDSFPLTQKDLEEISEDYLEKYCSEVRGFDPTVWTLYNMTKQRISTFSEEEPTRLETNSGRVKAIMKEFIIHKDVDSFIEVVFKYNKLNDDQLHYRVDEDLIIEIFDTVGEFEKSLLSGTLSSKYLAEFSTFLKELKIKGFDHFIPFEFKVIPIKEFAKKRNIDRFED